MHVFVNDIQTEVELVWDTGKLFARKRPVEHDQALPSLASVFSSASSSDLTFESHVSDRPDDLSENTRIHGDSDMVVIERTVLCVEELVLEHCFSKKQFNGARFIELMNGLASFDTVRHVFFTKKRTRCLSTLLTSVMRKVFVCLSLTRTQIDTITRLFKCALLLLSDDNAQVAKQIHTNYNSCIREALAHCDEKDEYVYDCFQQCTCFSIALDTALFGQEHIMSCTVRFVFETSVAQFPLFMAVCDASSGEEMAAFVLSKLLEKRAVFSKLVSLTTDGANNMIWNEQGLCLLLPSVEEPGDS